MWMVCHIDVPLSFETDPDEYASEGEAIRTARKRVEERLKEEAEMLMKDADISCREATEEEIEREIDSRERLDRFMREGRP